MPSFPPVFRVGVLGLALALPLGGCKDFGDVTASIAFHRSHGRKATLTAVVPPGRYGALSLDGDRVERFVEKPPGDQGFINGGFFVLDPSAVDLIDGDQTPWEGAPLETLHQTCKESNQHLATVREIAEPMGIRFLGIGGSPKWTLAETPRMPKSRYDIMTRYMPKVGTKGLDMMYRTCTIQVNLDFSSEEDMRRKMRVSMKLQSLATALFSSSPFTEAKPNGLLSWRGDMLRSDDQILVGAANDHNAWPLAHDLPLFKRE